MECDREDLSGQLVELLYDDGDPASRAETERHVRGCPACRAELEALRGVRRDLGAWRLPEPRSLAWAAGPRPGRGWTRLAAAAVLLLALGGALGLSGLSVSYERGPFRIALGRPAAAEGLEPLAERQHVQEQRLAALQRALEERAVSGEELMAQVRVMLAESEARQRALMDAGWSELVARTETQRRYDLARVSAGLSYLDRRSGEHAARTTELVGYLLKAAEQR